MMPTDWMTDTITVSNVTGMSAGDETFGTQYTVKGRVRHQNDLVVNAQGQDANSSHTAFSLVEIPVNARVWLPGDDTSNVNAARRGVAHKKTTSPEGDWTFYEVSF